MATLVQDNFDRANSTTVLGSPQIGPDPVVRAGVGGISSNQAYFPTVGYATYDCGVTDVEISAVASGWQSIASRGIYFFFGWVSTTDFWRVYWDTTNGAQVRLSKQNAGGLVDLQVVTRSVVAGDLLKASLKSGQFRVYLNGDLLFTYTAETPITSTHHGFGINHSGSRADDLLIVDAPALPPDTPADGHTVTDPQILTGASAVLASSFVYRGRDTKTLDIAGGA